MLVGLCRPYGCPHIISCAAPLLLLTVPSSSHPTIPGGPQRIAARKREEERRKKDLETKRNLELAARRKAEREAQREQERAQRAAERERARAEAAEQKRLKQLRRAAEEGAGAGAAGPERADELAALNSRLKAEELERLRAEAGIVREKAQEARRRSPDPGRSAHLFFLVSRPRFASATPVLATPQPDAL